MDGTNVMVPTIENEGDGVIEGVFVLYYPPGLSYCQGQTVDNYELAKRVASHVKPGAVICIPEGYGWRLEFVKGDASQVTVKETP